MPLPEQISPDLAEIEFMARRTFASLPDRFRAACGNVHFQVAEVATNEVLEAMDIDNPLDLMGLFEGVGRPQAGETKTGDLPNIIWLYRRPMLDYAIIHREPIEYVVAHVLIHEIGHHMGFDDEDLERIERGSA